MSETKLLPCPFCGGDAEYVCSNDGDYIECTRCGLGTTRHEQGSVNSVQRWNTRNEADALRAQVERLKDADDSPRRLLNEVVAKMQWHTFKARLLQISSGKLLTATAEQIARACVEAHKEQTNGQ